MSDLFGEEEKEAPVNNQVMLDRWDLEEMQSKAAKLERLGIVIGSDEYHHRLIAEPLLATLADYINVKTAYANAEREANLRGERWTR